MKRNLGIILLIATSVMVLGSSCASRAKQARKMQVELAKIQAKTNTTLQAMDPTIRAGQARTQVSRDAPGQTALERTIIRWFFDSDPRGARISWRVVSGIPDIVKNTNETYLTTTPYEETRAFDILGLTYENSRNVQIEVKVARRGFEDQVKRFNVRQSIDQREISGFFEMVAKPEE